MKKIIVILLIFLFTGCYDYHELNEIDIVTGIAIDKDKDEYQISYVISNAQKPDSSSENSSAQITILTGHGKNLTDAKLDLKLKNPKATYLGHVSVVVVSEEVAKESMYQIIDNILRDPESMQKFFLIITRDCKANEIVKTLSPLENFSSDNISSNIKITNKEQGFGVEVKLSDFLNNILRDGITSYLPTVTLEGKNNGATNQEDLQNTEVKTYASISTIALFDDYKLVHYATRNESRGINILNNQIKLLSLSTSFKGQTIGTNFNDVKSTIKLTFKNDKPIFSINVKAVGAIEEITGKFDLNDPKIIKEIENNYSKKLKKMINESITIIKKLKVDPIGFGNKIYSERPVLFKKIKKTYLDEMDIEIKVKTTIKTEGTLSNTIKEAKTWN